MQVQGKRFWDTVYLTFIRETVINRSVAGKLRNVALTVVTAGIAVLSASAADVWIVALLVTQLTINSQVELNGFKCQQTSTVSVHVTYFG